MNTLNQGKKLNNQRGFTVLSHDKPSKYMIQNLKVVPMELLLIIGNIHA